MDRRIWSQTFHEEKTAQSFSLPSQILLTFSNIKLCPRLERMDQSCLAGRCHVSFCPIKAIGLVKMAFKNIIWWGWYWLLPRASATIAVPVLLKQLFHFQILSVLFLICQRSAKEKNDMCQQGNCSKMAGLFWAQWIVWGGTRHYCNTEAKQMWTWSVFGKGNHCS